MTSAILTASSWIQDAIVGIQDLLHERKIRRAQRESYKRTLNELGKLTDFELNDIGICRGETVRVRQRRYPLVEALGQPRWLVICPAAVVFPVRNVFVSRGAR